MILDYTLLDPPPNESELPDPLPDPRDWAEHCEACQRISEEMRCKRRCVRRRMNPADNPPTDDAPLSALEPFGLDSDNLTKLDGQLFDIHDARYAVAHPDIHIDWLGPECRRKLAQALRLATRWLAKNPPNRH